MSFYNDFYDGLNDSRNNLYREIDTVSNLNKLFSTLHCHIQNLNNYQTNATGEETYYLNIKIDEIIDIFSNSQKQIQDLIKIKKGYPLYQLNDIENISLIKTLPSMDYKYNQIIKNITHELTIIKNLIKTVIENASREGDYSTIFILASPLFKIDQLIHFYS